MSPAICGTAAAAVPAAMRPVPLMGANGSSFSILRAPAAGRMRVHREQSLPIERARNARIGILTCSRLVRSTHANDDPGLTHGRESQPYGPPRWVIPWTPGPVRAVTGPCGGELWTSLTSDRPWDGPGLAVPAAPALGLYAMPFASGFWLLDSAGPARTGSMARIWSQRG